MEGWNNGTMEHWKIILVALAATSALAAEPKITCEPRELRGLLGQPLQLEVTVETDRAAPIKIQIPGDDLLLLHSVEKNPIQRTEAGRYVQKRIIIWQGVEAGSTILTNLTVRSQGLEVASRDGHRFFQTLEKKSPSIGKEKAALTQSVPNIEKKQQAATQVLPNIGIVIDAVEPAEPPALTEAEE
jgi:hypothetical protein